MQSFYFYLYTYANFITHIWIQASGIDIGPSYKDIFSIFYFQQFSVSSFLPAILK